MFIAMKPSEVCAPLGVRCALLRIVIHVTPTGVQTVTPPLPNLIPLVPDRISLVPDL